MAGYVGAGMLAAAVCGEVFASPSEDAVLAAIRAVTGPAGAHTSAGRMLPPAPARPLGPLPPCFFPILFLLCRLPAGGHELHRRPAQLWGGS
jgi:hypothetical protein